MTYESFIGYVRDCRVLYPEQRNGQLYFNLLDEVRPELAQQVQGTDRDPFYDDGALPGLLYWLALSW